MLKSETFNLVNNVPISIASPIITVSQETHITYAYIARQTDTVPTNDQEKQDRAVL